MKYIHSLNDVDFPMWLPEAESIYSDAWLCSVATKFRIAEALIDELGENLRINGANYLSMKNAAQQQGLWKSRQTTFSEIGKNAAKLLSHIDGLDERGADLFWQPGRSGGLSHDIGPGEVGRYGHTVRRIGVPGGGFTPIYLRENDILEALTILRNYASRASEQIPHNPSGRPPNDALNFWVSNMRLVWTGLLDWRFTLSTSGKEGGNEGKSRAFLFCLEALKPLDDTVTSIALQSAMRSEAKDARSLNGKQNGKKPG